MTSRKASRPCEAVGTEPYKCYWQIQGMCAAYNPSVTIIGGIKVPLFSDSSAVPVDFCESHQIVKSDVDAWFNRNITTMKYERLVEHTKKVTKKEEKEMIDSGSTRQEVKPAKKQATKKPVKNTDGQVEELFT